MKKLLNTLYVTDPNAYLCKEDENILIKVGDKKALKLPLHVLDSIVLFGYLGCSPTILGRCAEEGISVTFMDEYGRYLARVEGAVTGNVLLRRKQYRLSDSPQDALHLAQQFIAAKVRNSKIILQRHTRDYPEAVTENIQKAVTIHEKAEKSIFMSSSLDSLRGIEGDAAHSYFGAFSDMLRIDCIANEFQGRVRRPPLDPVNAMLSFMYTLLSRDIVSACESVGLDPQVGYLHRDRPGRASLALDIMEEMRPYIVDRFVLTVFNRRQLELKDFQRQASGAVMLKDDSRKKVLNLWQERKKDNITHPFLGEKMPLGLLPFIQAQLLARYIRNDLDEYPAFLWR